VLQSRVYLLSKLTCKKISYQKPAKSLGQRRAGARPSALGPARNADGGTAKRTSWLARDLTWRRTRAWNADMASDPQVLWNFECPSCGAKYLKTKIEDQVEIREGANCKHCLASFEPREGAHLLQYQLIEHPSTGR
jgi:hypothetical protein